MKNEELELQNVSTLFLNKDEEYLVKLVKTKSPNISLKKKFVRTFHDLLKLYNYPDRFLKNVTLKNKEKVCSVIYYRYYYVFLYYFLFINLAFAEILNMDSFSDFEEYYAEGTEVLELEKIEFTNEDGYYFPNYEYGWDKVQYFAFVNAYTEYEKWTNKKGKIGTKKYQDIENLERLININKSETRNKDGVYLLRILTNQRSKYKSDRTRVRLYNTKKIKLRKDYWQDFELIDEYYDIYQEDKNYSIKQYLTDKNLTKTFFYKVKKKYFKQEQLKKYKEAYEFMQTTNYDGDFNRLKSKYKISKRKMDEYIFRYGR